MTQSREELLADKLEKIAKIDRTVGAVALPESRIKIIEEAAAHLRAIARDSATLSGEE